MSSSYLKLSIIFLNMCIQSMFSYIGKCTYVHISSMSMIWNSILGASSASLPAEANHTLTKCVQGNAGFARPRVSWGDA